MVVLFQRKFTWAVLKACAELLWFISKLRQDPLLFLQNMFLAAPENPLPCQRTVKVCEVGTPTFLHFIKGVCDLVGSLLEGEWLLL